MLVRAVENDNLNSGRTWVFGKGFTSYKKEQTAIQQQVKSSLLEFVDDCYFALDSGIDWKTRLGYHNQKNSLDDDIVRIINSINGIIKIEDFKSTVQDRNYMSICSIYTIYSEQPISFKFSKGA